MSKQCWSCGARDGETAFPEKKKRGERRRCCDCLEEMLPAGDRIDRPVMLSRRAWRARERARAASPQADMIDWLSA